MMSSAEQAGCRFNRQDGCALLAVVLLEQQNQLRHNAALAAIEIPESLDADTPPLEAPFQVAEQVGSERETLLKKLGDLPLCEACPLSHFLPRHN